MLKSPRDALYPEDLPEPPSRNRRSKRSRNPLVAIGSAIFSLMLLATVLAFGGIYYGGQRLEAAGPATEDRTVLIARGSGTGDIADSLETAGIIDDALFFGVAVRVLGKADELKAGEYLFKAGLPMSGVIDVLVEGKGIQHQITIPEGLTSELVVARLMENTVLTGEVGNTPAEGSLLPDTYSFERGTTREQIIQRMQAAQRKLVADIWSRRAPDILLKSPQELVTLASIVEKETAVPEERTRVASVFHNRLGKRMRLQSDPTIIYGIVGGKGKLDRPIRRSDITGPTPYNTYVIPGLPPGPIANPGRASLEATANPEKSDYLYFVADGTGGHAFATTLDDHNANVRRWREIERSRDPEAAAADEDADAARSAAGGEGETSTEGEAVPAAAKPKAKPKNERKKKTDATQ